MATLSDIGRVFEDAIDDANGTATNYDADDFFGSVSSRIRFGSTGGTRFGAYAVTDAGEPAASNNWDTSVFACTSDNEHRGDDIPRRHGGGGRRLVRNHGSAGPETLRRQDRSDGRLLEDPGDRYRHGTEVRGRPRSRPRARIPSARRPSGPSLSPLPKLPMTAKGSTRSRMARQRSHSPATCAPNPRRQR